MHTLTSSTNFFSFSKAGFTEDEMVSSACFFDLSLNKTIKGKFDLMIMSSSSLGIVSWTGTDV